MLLAWKNFLHGQRSPTASTDNTCERGELVHVQDVDALEPCSILRLWSAQHATHFQIAPAFGAGSSCEFPNFVFDVLLILSGFIRLCSCIELRLSALHNLRNLSVLSGNDVLQCRTLGFLDLLDLVPTRHRRPLKRIITFPGASFNIFVFSLLLCVMVSESLFTVHLRLAFVHFCTFLVVLNQFFCKMKSNQSRTGVKRVAICQASGHRMHRGHVECPVLCVRAARLLMVCRTDSSHRIQRLLQCIMLECLQSGQHE